jgi:hypothetical protein
LPFTGYELIGDTPLELLTVHGAVSCEWRRRGESPTLLIVVGQAIFAVVIEE